MGFVSSAPGRRLVVRRAAGPVSFLGLKRSRVGETFLGRLMAIDMR